MVPDSSFYVPEKSVTSGRSSLDEPEGPMQSSDPALSRL